MEKPLNFNTSKKTVYNFLNELDMPLIHMSKCLDRCIKIQWVLIPKALKN